MIIPIGFLILCLTYFVQVIELSFISVAFATFCVVVIVPVSILIILKFGISREKEEILEAPAQPLSARLNLRQIVSLRTSDNVAVKQIRYLVLYMLCLGIVCHIFGFNIFTPCFVLLTLYTLGVTKPIQYLSISAGVGLFMYLIFDRLLMFPLPRGILFY
jgi:hypothetical protein